MEPARISQVIATLTLAQVRGLAGETNTIRIGDNLPQGNQSNCYIGGVFDGHVGTEAFIIAVNADNKVGDTALPGSPSKLRFSDVIQDHKKVAELEATIAGLTTQLKEQAAQIQKVSAQIQTSKPGREVALNNP